MLYTSLFIDKNKYIILSTEKKNRDTEFTSETI